ncbi:hypothetical protein NSQ95_01480 [Psychrobacillus sp. FSL W7-1457]|uniref:hypothetical protein n=1 Tax=unclassified Psychrobacillus TaxID=2636677 RepID=UPI0030FCD2A3
MSKKRKNKKKKNIIEEGELFGEFAFIAGYTEGGAPYGILHDEWDELNYSEEDENVREDNVLPF